MSTLGESVAMGQPAPCAAGGLPGGEVIVDPALVAPEQSSWKLLAQAACRCVACPELAATRTQVVPGVRTDTSDVLVVGEAPGAQEDSLGVPFVGKAGQLLDTLLNEAGLSQSRIAVANVLKCRPPRNRTPQRQEIENCRPWLTAQLDLLQPRLVIALGSTAAGWFFGSGARIAALRQEPQDYDGQPVIVSYHPSAAIRFGPNGAPLAALRTDLAGAARMLGRLRADDPIEAATEAFRR